MIDRTLKWLAELRHFDREPMRTLADRLGMWAARTRRAGHPKQPARLAHSRRKEN